MGFVRTVRALERLTSQLEEIGENDMGEFREHVAGRFHDAVAALRNLTTDLQQDVAWPHEPEGR